MKLAKKISLLIGLLVFVISLSTGILVLVITSNVINGTVEQTLAKQAETGAALVEETIRADLAAFFELAIRATTQTMDWRIQHNSLLPDIERLGYLDIALVNMAGQAQYISNNSVADLSSRNYIQAALAGKTNISDVIISRVTNQTVVMLAAPVYSGNTIAAALIARKDGSALSEITNAMGFGKTGYSYMINEAGVIVSHPNNEYVMNQLAPIEAAKKDSAMASLGQSIQEILIKKAGTAVYTLDGKKMMAGFAPVADRGWYLVVTAENDEVLAGFYTIRTWLFILTASFLAIGIIVAMLIGNSLARPLVKMLPVLEGIAAGNLSARVHIQSDDEIGVMGKEFNASIDGLHDMVQTTKQASDSLEGIAGRLNNTMSKTSEAAKLISDNIARVKQKTLDQSASVTETHATIEGIKNNSEKLNASIEGQSSAVIQSSSAVEEMVANIKSVAVILQKNATSMTELLFASEKGKDGVQKVSEIMKDIQKDSEGLLEATTMIEHIAQETNLLAMNAAIEAAHAGDAGKGFAVVAGEIRKLAENSSTQGKAISSVLGSLKNQINQANILSKNSQESFQKILSLLDLVQKQEIIIKNAMDEQASGSTELLSAMRQINDITSQVRDGSSEMMNASSMILKEMGYLTEATEVMNREVDEVSGSTVEINSAVENMSRITRETRENISTLSQGISKFKTKTRFG